jgi:hypothetical protein
MKPHYIIRAIGIALLIFVSAAGIPDAFSQCSCFAQLKYRGVDVGVVPTGYNHAFWWVQSQATTTWIIEGGPSGDCILTCGQLIDWVVAGNTGHYSQDNYQANLSYTIPQGTTLCDQVNQMLIYSADFNTTTFFLYVIAGAPNSNTFAHNVANAGGVGSVPAPPSTIGW